MGLTIRPTMLLSQIIDHMRVDVWVKLTKRETNEFENISDEMGGGCV